MPLSGGVCHGPALFESVISREQSKENIFNIYFTFVCQQEYFTYHHNPNQEKCIYAEKKYYWHFVSKEIYALSSKEWARQTEISKIQNIVSKVICLAHPKSVSLPPSSPGFNILREHHITIVNKGNPVRIGLEFIYTNSKQHLLSYLVDLLNDDEKRLIT